MNVFRFGLAVAVASALVTGSAATSDAELSKTETKCAQAIEKGFAKLQVSLLKIRSSCHLDDISGKDDSANGCATLSTDDQEAVDKVVAKFVAGIAKRCSSVCNTAIDLSCVTDLDCPANHTSNKAIAEFCWGKGNKKKLDLRNLDFPGPYCPTILGGELDDPSDLGACLVTLADWIAGPLEENIYGDLDETSGLTDTGIDCLSTIGKAVPSALARSYLATAECRDARQAAPSTATPAWACSRTDTETIESVQAEIDKMREAIAGACSDGDVASLDGLCAGGGSPVTTVSGAQDCFEDLVREVATEERGENRHVFSKVGMLNITHPPSAAPYCGDGIVTERRDEDTGIGEECDGSDAPCGAGSCRPPGDLFQCTCDNIPRERFIITGTADSDAGWNGASHDATHNENFGYTTELSDCNCSEVTQATCTGSTSDSECTIRGNMAPKCSDDIDGTETCDERGDGDQVPESSDCNRCGDDSLNPGTYCSNVGGTRDESVCQSQCFVVATDTATGTPCSNSTQCGTGEVCRGRCDDSIQCLTMSEGSPLPLVTALIPVCVALEYKTDIVGTKDIVTGAQAAQYATRSSIRTGLLFAAPCPVCNGLCVGGTSNGQSCFGRCDGSGAECLMDSDCTGMGDTACLESAADCPGGACSLDLRCSDGENKGGLCQPDAYTPLGIVSHDCPMSGGAISGIGVQQNFGTVTTGETEFPAPSTPCTDPTWNNFDCPCPADVPGITGTPTRPNGCGGACMGGVNDGLGCVVGFGGDGQFTTCNGGSEHGKPCDADSDCTGGLCNANPRQCVGGPTSKLGFSCIFDSNCDGGIGDPPGVCADACPAGRCVPLCLPEGRCTAGLGGVRAGDTCATAEQCKQCTAGNPGLIGQPCAINSFCNSAPSSGDGVCSTAPGVTCDVFDAEDGVCAGGPIDYKCNGEGYTSVPCSLSYGRCGTLGKCEVGSPSLYNQNCSVNSDCLATPNVPVHLGCEDGNDGLPGTDDDIPGSGQCEPRPHDCYVNNGYAIGGGTADQPQVNAAFCTPPNANDIINNTSGFGGPSRIRRQGDAFINMSVIP